MRQLNERGVSRLEHLEVLLVLSRHPGRTFDGEQVATSSTISRAVVEETLAHLHKHEMLVLVPGERPVYRLGPRSELPLLDLLRTHHERDRIAVVNAFYSCNLESLRSFASAFRIRRQP
ncbi:MAG: Rrf2 family transcriptional regulator [Nannocystis sp.]|nr:hypothetical protein [Nannocystis sp.]MBA3547253.1 Rrf2 family transcriptional regulator [Nannocystis sp.]